METNPIIYALCEPGGDIRYIGQTISIVHRIASHIYVARHNIRKTHTNDWLRSLLARNIRPEVIMVEECANTHELDQAEIRWIANYRILGCKLTNHHEGGQAVRQNQTSYWKGKRLPPEVCDKLRKAALGRKASDATKLKMSLRSKGKRKPPMVESTKLLLSIARTYAPDADGLRLCSRCQQWKVPTKFHTKNSNRSGLDRWCKSCKNSRNSAHRNSKHRGTI